MQVMTPVLWFVSALLMLAVLRSGAATGQLVVVGVDTCDTSGNLDGYIDAGEDGRIDLQLLNVGDYGAGSVLGVVSTSDPLATITDGLAWWGNIQNGTAEWSSANTFGIHISPQNRQDSLELSFLITWRDPSNQEENSAQTLTIPINQGFQVAIDTGGSLHEVGGNLTITITAGLRGKLDQEPVLAAKAAANVTRPNFSVDVSISLRDDGTDGDAVANDGNYTGIYPINGDDPLGLYRIDVIATRDCLYGKLSSSFKVFDPFLVWNRTYGGSKEYWVNGVAAAGDGGFVIAGSTYSFDPQHEDVYLVKVDREGNRIWERTYGTSKDDRAYAVVPSDDGGFVVAGYANSPPDYRDTTSSADIYLLKVDADGNKVWETIYGEDGYEWAFCITQSQDGGFIVGGSKPRQVGGHICRRVCVLKIDVDGNKVWEKTYGGSRDDRAFAITQSGDGGYVLAGFGNDEQDVYVLKIDSGGEKMWDKTYGGGGRDYAQGIVRTDDGFIVVGFTIASGLELDLYMLRIDRDGGKLWERILNKTTSSWANTIVRSGDGFVIVGGLGGLGDSRAYLAKIDCSGNVIWETFNWTLGLEGTDMVETGDGGFVLVGGSSLYGRGHVYVAKIKGTPWIALPEPCLGFVAIVLLAFIANRQTLQ